MQTPQAEATKIAPQNAIAVWISQANAAISCQDEDTTIIKDFSALTAPKTKEFVKIIDTLKLTGKILIIADTKLQENQHLELAARNLPNVRIILPSNINVKDILEADSVVMSEASVAEITERLMK